MKFFVIIGKENLYVYEKNGSRYEKQFIEGNAFYPYDVCQVKADIDAFLDSLANEKNLGTKAKLEFEVLENPDPIRTNSVMRILGEFTKRRLQAPEVIRDAIQKLSRDKTLMIDAYGINYDGRNYKMDGQMLLDGPFDLLGYTIHEDDIMDLLSD